MPIGHRRMLRCATRYTTWCRSPSLDGRMMGPAVTPDRRTLLAFGGAVLFGGVNAIAIRQAVLEIPPLWAMATRFLAAGVVLVVLSLALRRPFPRGRSFWGAALYGAVGFAGGFAPVATG